MKKSILILVLAALFGACAEPVSPEMAKAVANAWVARNAPFKAGTSAKSVFAEHDPADASVVLWYQVSMAGGGCLMVAPDTEIEPVVAALDNDPGVLPPTHPLRGILTGDMRDRLAFLAKGKKKSGPSLMGASPLPADDAAVVAREWGAQQKAKWAKLGINTGVQLQESASVGVNDPIAIEIGIVPGFEKGGALTHWNQSGAGGYNLFTPGHSVCGCVATATSAIMQFFRVQKYQLAEGATEPGAECTYNGAPYKAEILEPDEPFDWSILPRNWGGDAEEADKLDTDQAKLIGRLAYNAGVCHNMMWSNGESGAYSEDTAHVLRDYFGFKEARLVTKPKQEEYRKLIYMQCWCGAPVGMGIKGHAVVAVGYGKDAEGVDRVRVFMGWGGSGDGWYALPYIDTTAVVGGSSYLSTVVNSITTMIALDDDNVFPVTGQLIPTVNAPVTINGVTTNANKMGYFGIRLSAAEMKDGGSLTVECQDKSWDFTVSGADPADAKSGNGYTSSGAGLCKWISDAVILPLINAPSATTFADAKTLALELERPVLAISGSWGEETTDAAWAIIQQLDNDNVDDFTNKFVVLCMPYMPSGQISDGNPSFALFNPADYTVGDLWSPENGRLAYWGVYGRQYTTNETLYAELYNPTNASANRYISQEEIVEGVYSVLDATDQHKLALAAITIESTTGEPGTEDSSYCYVRRNLQLPASACNPIEAPSVITNGAVIWECAGWTALTNGVEYASGTTSSATFAVAASNTYTVVWDWTPSAYKVTFTTAYEKDNGQPFDFGDSSVEEALAAFDGWYASNDVISISAPAVIQPNAYHQYAFANWRVNQRMITDWVTWDAAGGAKAVVSGPSLTFTVGGAPVTILASYNDLNAAGLPGSGKYLLAVAAEGNVGFTAPDTLWGTNVLTAVNDLGNMPNLIVRLASASKNVNGVVWKCTQYVYNGVTNDAVKGATSALALTAGTNNLVWLWTPSDVPPPPESFVIDWDVALSNLSSSDFSTNVLTLAALEASGKTLEDVKNATTVPRGWKPEVSVDGQNVVVKLALNEEELADSMSGVKVYIAPNVDEPGMLTVSANVPDGIRGFWYSIFGADELPGPWSVVAEGAYEKDVSETEPSVQVQSEADKSTDKVTLSIAIDPTKTKQFYKVKVTEKRPAAE